MSLQALNEESEDSSSLVICRGASLNSTDRKTLQTGNPIIVDSLSKFQLYGIFTYI